VVKVSACSFAMLLGASAQGAFVVDDPSFFAGKAHTFLDFESRGDGTPVGLGFLESEFFGTDEYLSTGIRFAAGQYAWDTVPPPTIGTPLDPDGLGGLGDAVAAIGNVPTVYAPSEASEIHFLNEVHAFGIGVVQLGFPASNVPDPDRTTVISAFDSTGSLLGEVRLWLDTIDGHFGAFWMTDDDGNDWYTYQYGFLGLASETPIAFIRFENRADSLFDSFYFSAVPAPGGATLLGLGALGVVTRRRR
jgi:hypothetical protein